MNTEVTDSADSADPGRAPVDVGLGIVLRSIPNETRERARNITPTECDHAGCYEILLTRRPEHTVYGGYWELPGGKCEPGEPIDQCVERELAEEVGVVVDVVAPLNEQLHEYPHAVVRLHPRVCRLAAGSPEPRPLEVDALRWVEVGDLSGIRFPEANDNVLADLRLLIGAGGLAGRIG